MMSNEESKKGVPVLKDEGRHFIRERSLRTGLHQGVGTRARRERESGSGGGAVFEAGTKPFLRSSAWVVVLVL